MSTETKSIQDIYQEGYPNVLVAALSLHPEANANGRYSDLLITLRINTGEYVKATQRPSPNRDQLERRKQQLLDRMKMFIELFEVRNVQVGTDKLPPPVSVPPPEGTVERVLFLGANPSAMGRLQLQGEYVTITEQLQSCANFRLHVSRATTRNTIGAAIAEFRPSIIHFSGHGIGAEDGFHKGGIVLEDSVNHARADILSAEDLAALIAANHPAVPVRLVVLNACESGDHARVIAAQGFDAIGMKEEVADGRAIAFARGFYRGLALEPQNTAFAFGLGVAELSVQGLSGAAGVPVLHAKAVV